MSTDQRDDRFLASLFDFSFTSFITTKLIKVLYVLALIGVGVWALALLIAGLSRGGAAAFFSVVGAVLGFFFGIIYVRVLLELVIVVFRIGENTATMARSLGGHGTPAWQGGGASPVAPPAQPYRAPDPTPQPSPGWEPPPAPRAEGDDPTRRLPGDRDEPPRPGPGDVPPPPPA